jgi:glutathione-regulated potassium-efflux system ancillary protein KefG
MSILEMKVLLLFFHPNQEISSTNRYLIQDLPVDANFTFRSLYNEYPTGFIDVPLEKKFLLENDVILFQHPLYWYSCPPLMKQWIDWVFELGWAYGKNGNALEGKIWKQIISSGGSYEAYTQPGFHKHPITEFLLPFQRTAELCNMKYHEPFLIYGANSLTIDDLKIIQQDYKQIILNFCKEGKNGHQ